VHMREKSTLSRCWSSQTCRARHACEVQQAAASTVGGEQLRDSKPRATPRAATHYTWGAAHLLREEQRSEQDGLPDRGRGFA
jgi:hypothetical protein